MRNTSDNDTPISELDRLFRQVPALIANCRDGQAQLVLSTFRADACIVLDMHDLPPAERNFALVQVAYDHLVELRGRVATEPWLSEADILREPLTTVEELIDLAREMLA